MTVYKDANGRGSWVVERQFPGVGRIKRATGTNDLRVAREIDQMLVTLYNAGRLDVLETIRTKSVRLIECYTVYRTEGIRGIPTPENIVSLGPGLFNWLETYDCSEKHRAGMRGYFKSLIKVASKPGATVGDLPGMLREYRERMRKHAPMVNKVRSALQAYLRDTLGRFHPTYQAVAEIRPLRHSAAHGTPLSVEQIDELVGQLTLVHGRQCWSMVSTGMMPDEYFGGKFKLGGDTVEIHGTKTSARVRVVPLIARVTYPETTYKPFLKALRKASDGVLKPYDLRRTYARWLEDAGIVESRALYYFGHGPKKMIDRYRRHDVEPYMQGDGKKLRRFMTRERNKVKAVS